MRVMFRGTTVRRPLCFGLFFLIFRDEPKTRDLLELRFEQVPVQKDLKGMRTIRSDQLARSKRSRFITLSHAATKSLTNFSFASVLA